MIFGNTEAVIGVIYNLLEIVRFAKCDVFINWKKKRPNSSIPSTMQGALEPSRPYQRFQELRAKPQNLYKPWK